MSDATMDANNMSDLTWEDIQCIRQIADNLEACEKRHWLQSEITSTLIAIVNEQTFSVQLFFGRVGFTGTSFEMLPTAAGVRDALTQYEEDRRTQQNVASRQVWEKSTAVQQPDDVVKKFGKLRDFWDYCHEQKLIDEGNKSVCVDRVVHILLKRAGAENSTGTSMSKTACNNSLGKLKFPVYISAADLAYAPV